MANLTWVAGAAGHWLDQGNWVPAGVPGPGDTLTVQSGSPAMASITIVGEIIRLLGPVTLSLLSATFEPGPNGAVNIYVSGGDDENPTHATIEFAGTNSFLGNIFVEAAGGGSLTINGKSPDSTFVIEEKAFLFGSQESLLSLASGRFTNNGIIHIEGVGVIGEAATLVGSGGWIELDSGARLEVDGTVGARQSVNFGDGTATLVLTDPATFKATIGLTDRGGDRIILEGMRARSADFEDGTLSLYAKKNLKGDLLASIRIELINPADFGPLARDEQTLASRDFDLSKLDKTGTLITYDPRGPTYLEGSLPLAAVGKPGETISLEALFESAFGTAKPHFKGLKLLPSNTGDPADAAQSYWGQPGINTVPPIESGWIVNGKAITKATVVKKGDLVSFRVGNNIDGPPQIEAQLTSASKGRKAVYQTLDVWAVDRAVVDLIPAVPGRPTPADVLASAAAFEAVYGTVLNSDLCNWIADNVAAAAGATMPIPDAELISTDNVSGGFWRIVYSSSAEAVPVQDWNTLVAPGDIVRLQWETTGGGHTTTVLGVNEDGTINVFDNIDMIDGEHHIGAHDDVAYWKKTDPASITIYRLDPNHEYLIEGTRRAEYLQGSVFDDLILARLGADRIFGSIGDDELRGGGGADKLRGGPGDDLLTGGPNGDKLSGGDGANVFAYTATKQSKPTASHRDTILDFKTGTDKIDLTAINAMLEASGRKPFHFIAEAPLTGRPGQLHYIDFGRYLLVEGDKNGDGVADFAVKVFGSEELTGGDFLL